MPDNETKKKGRAEGGIAQGGGYRSRKPKKSEGGGGGKGKRGGKHIQKYSVFVLEGRTAPNGSNNSMPKPRSKKVSQIMCRSSCRRTSTLVPSDGREVQETTPGAHERSFSQHSVGSASRAHVLKSAQRKYARQR